MSTRNRRELWKRTIRELMEDPVLELRLKQIPTAYLEEPSLEAVEEVIPKWGE